MLCEQVAGIKVVKVYNDPLKFLKEFSTMDFDVCILDIEMPGIDGLKVAQHLHDKAVVFSTAYKEYAAEAFDQEAVDYIRKPYQLERVEKAIVKARSFVEQHRLKKSSFAEFNSNKGKILLRFMDVAYITTAENDRRDKKALMRDNQEFVLKNISFDKLLEHLPQDKFCRINRQTVVSLDYVSTYTHDLITCRLTNNNEKPLQFMLSEQFRETFKSKIRS